MARGYIRKRGERSWQLVYDIPRGTDGKRRQRYETIQGTKRQAEARLTEILDGVNRGEHHDVTRLTVSEYLDLWLRDYAAARVRPRTLSGYQSIVESAIKPALGLVRLADLTGRQVDAFYTRHLQEGRSAYTVIHYHRLLRQALGQAVKWDMLNRNVTDGVTPPTRRKPEFRTLAAEEVHALLAAAASTNYHVPLHLAIHTGLRRSEILGLRWKDVDLKGFQLTVSQTMTNLPGEPAHLNAPKSARSHRTVSFDEQTATLLRSQRERREAQLLESGQVLTLDTQVCVREDGRPIKPALLSHAFQRLCKRAGIAGIRLHDLRHTHATMLLGAGVPVHVVQSRLGHESIQTTIDIYGHVLRESDVEASATFANLLSATARGQNVGSEENDSLEIS